MPQQIIAVVAPAHVVMLTTMAVGFAMGIPAADAPKSPNAQLAEPSRPAWPGHVPPEVSKVEDGMLDMGSRKGQNGRERSV